ncbi:DUF4030 domain-containing protein [Peribacillus frigoritolerans]|uniref:DUF4030 domain-containing protein n=1 Tax=Peribacillus castrilensis TaxID=2897690 RepID=UPI003DA5C93F
MGHKEDDKQTLEQLQIPISLERFTKEIPKRYRDGEFAESRIEKVNQEWTHFQRSMRKQWSFGKKIAAFTIAAAASLVLFMGSGFVSPAMAKILAKIPPISSIYERNVEISDLITKELKKEGYPIKEVQEYGGGGKEGVYIYLEASDEKVKKMKPGIEKISFSILHGEKFKGTRIEDYYVRVRKFVDETKSWKKKQARIDKEITETFEIVNPVLKSYGYENALSASPETIELEFPNTESKEKIAEIQKAVEDALKTAGNNSFKVKTKTFNLAKREHYSRWSDAVTGIWHEFTTYKKYHVSGVGYKSIDGEKMQIEIRMNLPSTDLKTAELAKELNTMTEDFIHSEEIWQKVKDDPYEIIITSKDKKRMNE